MFKWYGITRFVSDLLFPPTHPPRQWIWTVIRILEKLDHLRDGNILILKQLLNIKLRLNIQDIQIYINVPGQAAPCLVRLAQRPKSHPRGKHTPGQ